VVKVLQQSDPPITRTILVADDQAANRELLEELLIAQGSKVITVPDAAAPETFCPAYQALASFSEGSTRSMVTPVTRPIIVASAG
jgi:CheY-like chemotaxis protein